MSNRHRHRVHYKGFYHHYDLTECNECRKPANAFYRLQVGEYEKCVAECCISKYKLKLPPVKELIAKAYTDNTIDVRQ